MLRQWCRSLRLAERPYVNCSSRNAKGAFVVGFCTFSIGQRSHSFTSRRISKDPSSPERDRNNDRRTKTASPANLNKLLNDGKLHEALGIFRNLSKGGRIKDISPDTVLATVQLVEQKGNPEFLNFLHELEYELRRVSTPMSSTAYAYAIRAYAACRQDVDWIPKLLNEMDTDHRTPNAGHLQLLLNACLKSKNTKMCSLIYGRYKQHCVAIPKHLLGMMIAIMMREGKQEEVQKLLHEIHETNHQLPLAVYESVMRTFLQERDHDNVRYLLSLDLCNVSPYSSDVIRAAHELALEACACIGDLERMEFYLQRMHAQSLVPRRSFMNFIVSFLTKHSTKEVTVDSLLEDMADFKMLRTVSVHNMMITHYARRRNLSKAEEYLSNLLSSDIQPDIRTFMPVLSAYADEGASVRAEMLFEDMRNHGIQPDALAYTALIEAHYRGSNLESACDAFAEMKSVGIAPDTTSYTLLMQAYRELDGENGITRCEGLLQEMRQAGVRPNVRTYLTLIKAHHNAPDVAMQHFNAIKTDGLVPDAYCYAAIINAFVCSGNMGQALEIFEAMRQMEVKPNAVIFNILLSAAADTGDVDVLTRLYQEMLSANVKPDSSTIFMFLDTYAKYDKHMRRAETLYKHFVSDRRQRFVVKQDVYHAMMNGYALRGNVKRCLAVRDDMMRAGYSQPDRIVNNILIHAHSRAGDNASVQSIWREMLENGTVGQDTIAAVLDSAGHNGTVKDIVLVVEECRHKGIEFQENTYNSYIEALARHTRFDEAIGVLYAMVGSGVDPSTKTYQTIMTPLIKGGRMDDVDSIGKFLKKHYPSVVPKETK